LSIAGIPLIPVALLFALCCFAFGLVSVGALIGQRLSTTKSDEKLLRNVALGMFTLAAGAALPFFGALILFVACVYGAGAVLGTRFGTQPPGPQLPMKESAPPSAAGTHLSESH
jgi:hypothetical protein